MKKREKRQNSTHSGATASGNSNENDVVENLKKVGKNVLQKLGISSDVIEENLFLVLIYCVVENVSSSAKYEHMYSALESTGFIFKNRLQKSRYFSIKYHGTETV